MDAIAVLARTVLVCAFVTSAAAKAVDQPGTRRAARSLGVPEPLAAPIALALVVVEGVLAAALLPGSTAVPAGLGSLGLLAAFSATVAANLVRGNRPSCGCFGPLADGELSRATLVRNAVLAALALVVVGTADQSIWSAVAELDVAELVGGTGLLLILAGVVLRRQRIGATAGARSGLPPLPAGALDAGEVAPDWVASRADGSPVDLGALLQAEAPVLLVFASTTCGACGAVLGQLGSWQDVADGRLTLAFAISGPSDVVAEVVRRNGLRTVIPDPDNAVAHAHRVTATPAAALIGVDRRLLSRIAHGGGEVFSLLLEGLGLREAIEPSFEGYDAPSDRTPGLEPEEITLSTAAAPREAVILFDHEGSPLLIDRELRGVVLLNAPAATIWQCLDGRSTLADISTDISEVFGVPPASAQDDVLATVRHLAGLGLLGPSSRSGPGPAHDRAAAQ